MPCGEYCVVKAAKALKGYRSDRPVRDPSGWTRRDSLLVLASYVARPPRMLLPPQPELDRVASLTRMPMAEIRRRMVRFAGHDPDNTIPQEEALGTRDGRLWKEYIDDPMRLMADAEWTVEEGRFRPKTLYKEGSGP